MNILLPVDGSACSLKAVQFVADSTAWFKETPRIALVYVDELGVAVDSARKRLGDEAVENYFNETKKETLIPAERILQSKDISYDSIYAGGDAATQICAHASARQADMIVIGSRGQSAIAGLLMGSVTTKVLAMTTIPVTVIR